VYAETKDWKITFHPERSATIPDGSAQSKDIVAYSGASHWQFVAYKSTLAQFLPFDMDKPMGQVRQLDQRMNERGLLRLMVSDPLVMNLSNTTDYVKGAYNTKQPAPKRAGFIKRFVQAAPIKKALLAVYDQIFRWYYS
jgi:hypothetical protein